MKHTSQQMFELLDLLYMLSFLVYLVVVFLVWLAEDVAFCCVIALCFICLAWAHNSKTCWMYLMAGITDVQYHFSVQKSWKTLVEQWGSIFTTAVFWHLAICFSSCLLSQSLRCRHVQVSNTDAIAFYERFGFRIIDRKENYYKRIEPADAFVLQKNLKLMPDADTPAVSEITDVLSSESETVLTTAE